MKRKLRIAAITLWLIALAMFAIAFVLEKSLPYRIGPANHARYLWGERLSVVGLSACVLAVGLGTAARQRFPIILGACSALAWLLLIPGGPHSGTNPQIWCYFNLRKIDEAKATLTGQKNLTNGTAVTAAEISPLIEGGFQRLECQAGGKYIIGTAGTEPRCSVHGSVSRIGEDRAGNRQRLS